MIDWTDELREKVINDYKEAEPTPANSMDIVVRLAEEIETQPNRVRAMLSKAGVYIKKDPGSAKAGAGGGDKPKSTRVNKADAQQALTDLIESLGKEADQDIIGKLTGKAAVYLTEVFSGS